MVEQRAKILIVDDDPYSIRVLAEGLSGDYQINVASSGAEAIERVMDESFDLIMLDIEMPAMDGYEVCKRLKDDPVAKHIPVIFASSRSSEEDEVLGLSRGAADYITKPYNMALVKARVNNQIKLKHKTDLLEQLVCLDGLTHIPNRRYFDERFNDQWRIAGQFRLPLAVGMVDIDFFKRYNDRLGHNKGDECLIKVAECLTRFARREGDIVARYGGEEFAVVWPGMDKSEAKEMAQRLCDTVREAGIAHPDSECADVVTVSVGLALGTPSSDTAPQLLLKAADDALYQSKSKGRNCVSLAGQVS